MPSQLRQSIVQSMATRAASRARSANRPRTANEVLDQALVTCFAAPDSFTGEDTRRDLGARRASMSRRSIMEALISCGARQAFPGEFTRRAVLNGKLDILQAEAIGDLIDARSQSDAADRPWPARRRTVAPNRWR